MPFQQGHMPGILVVDGRPAKVYCLLPGVAVYIGANVKLLECSHCLWSKLLVSLNLL